MIYEYNKKFYVKPFSNKIVEVNVEKKNNEFDVQPTKKVLYLTSDIQKAMSEVTLEQAYKKSGKIDNIPLDNIPLD